MDAERAQPPFGDPTGERALAVTALASSAALALAACGSCSSMLSPGSSPAAASSSSASAAAMQTTPASASHTLSETGSSLMAPLVAPWGPAYHYQLAMLNFWPLPSSIITLSEAQIATIKG